MKDFARLAVGIVLLGLAIFWSLQKSPESNPDETVAAANVGDDLKAPAPMLPSTDFAGTKPTGSAAPTESVLADIGTSDSNSTIGSVAPDFQASTRMDPTGAESLAAHSFSARQPPRISDQYQPFMPFRQSESQSRGTLVPVQPNASFGGLVQPSGVVHVIRDGDTLQSISREYFGTPNRYLDIYTLNRNVLSDPTQLPMNVELQIPAR